MTLPYAGLAVGTLGLVAGLLCLLVSMRDRASGSRAFASLCAALDAHQAECAGQNSLIAERVSTLELTLQNADTSARSGLSRPVRAHAFRLLRSGVPPEKAAAALGIGKREMHLLARVSRVLSVE